MDDRLRAQIFNNLNLRETDDLIEIWQTRNVEEWDEETFNIIEEILLARLGSMPVRSNQTQAEKTKNGEVETGISSFDKFEDSGISEINNPIPESLYMDEKALLLVGWPGHRNRYGRFGYDPLESDFELAHMEGTIIRLLLTRRFRTQNPIYLLLMTFVGCIYCLPLVFGGMAFLQGDLSSIIVLFLFSPYWVVGIGLLVNVSESLSTDESENNLEDGSAFF